VLLILALTRPLASLAAPKYAISKQIVEGHTTYHLIDSARKMDFGVVPDIGNFAYQFKVNGKDVLIPPESLKAYLEKHSFCCGIPFLSPWANRIDHDYYYFQGKKYLLNDDMGNLRRDQFKQAIHGLLADDSRWQVVGTGASDAGGAFITSRLEFYKYPDLMAQFPFAHTIEMTYRLKDGKLENTTVIKNISSAAMPVMMAYHPYFRPDGDRAHWTVSIGARTHWLLSQHFTATGETEPIENFLPHAKRMALGDTFLDGVFSNFDRSRDGLGHASVTGDKETIEVLYGPAYDFGVVYAPLPHSPSLICFEPQTGPTNSFNLNHEGRFDGLVALEPGKTFTASFWIVPTGY
jgi:aldose 1-epimerase